MTRVVAAVAGAALVAAGLAACSGPSRVAVPPSPHPTSASPATASPTSGGTTPGGTTDVAGRPRVRLQVPSEDATGAFSVARYLQVPQGWTASVWTLVPDARIEAWSPEGALLVSQPDLGQVSQLVPQGRRSPTVHVVLRRLSLPQGLAFARIGGHEVLYVGESDQIVRYPWGRAGIAGPPTVVAGDLPDLDPTGDDDHRFKDVVVAPDGTVVFNVGSSSNADPDDRTMTPPRAVIMGVEPDGRDLHVIERGVRNGEGLAVAPDGTVWTAVNERDNVPDPAGAVVRSYVDEHPPDEVAPVRAGADLGWPYCDPDQDRSVPSGSLADVPLVPDALTDPGGTRLDCARLEPVAVALPAHSAPVGLSFLEGTSMVAPWSGGAVVAAHGSWDRSPPRAPAVLWMAWDAARHTLEPSITLVGGFQLSTGRRWGRPADAVAGPDGALYVSDDTAGAVYRLVPPRPR